MSYKIRELRQADIPIVAHIYVEAYAHSLWGEEWNYDDALYRMKELLASPCYRALICESDDNEIVGCIFCEILRWHTGKQLEIKEVFVSSNHRRRGIGSKLVKSIENLGKKEGVGEFFLWTSGCSDLKEFYTRIGYYTCNETVQFVKKWRDTNESFSCRRKPS